MSDHPQADRHTDQDIPGAGPPSYPDPRRDWHRRLTLAALTGWHQLPADRLHDLVGTADPDQLPTLVHTPGVLANTDAGVLLSALMRRQDTAGHRWAHLLTAARLPDPTADPAARRDRLDLASRGFAEPVTTPQTDPSDRMVRTCWTTVPHRPSVPLTGHTGPVRAITTITRPDGRTLLAVGSDYETVRLWDPATGEQAGPTPTHHAEELCAMAAVALPDGRTLLATATTIAGEEWAVRLWDPTTGQQVGEDLTDHDGTVYAITAVALPDGRTLLATGSRDRTVRLWDPTTGEPVGRPLTGHTGWVYAMTTVAVPDGRTLLATGSDDETVRLWDPATGEPVGRPLTGHTATVSAITGVTVPDGRTLLATGSWDRTVRLWDPTTGQQIGPPLTGHTWAVSAIVTVAVPDGRTVLATTGDKRTVHLWDPTTAPRATPVVSQLRQVAVAPVLGTRSRPPLTGITGITGWVSAITTLAHPDGPALLALAGHDDRAVRLWDPATGEQAGRPLTGHTGTVSVMTPVTVPDGRTLLATGGADRTLRLWDPLTAEPIEVLHLPHPVGALTALPGGHLALGHGNETAVVTVRPASQQ